MLLGERCGSLFNDAVTGLIEDRSTQLAHLGFERTDPRRNVARPPDEGADVRGDRHHDAETDAVHAASNRPAATAEGNGFGQGDAFDGGLDAAIGFPERR